MKTDFNGVKATMLMTLYARALESRAPDPILADPWAQEAVSLIEYDFDRLKVGETRGRLVATRAKQLDLWTTRFLADVPDATVLHLGCGLDSRVYRVDPLASARWFDVDYPEVIEMRRQLYPQERSEYRMIGGSLTDLAWLDDVAGGSPVIIVAEGVLMYITPGEVKELLNQLVDHFPNGQVGFDVLSRQLVRWTKKSGTTVRDTGASFVWGVDSPRDVAALEPRLELMADLRLPQLAGYARVPWATRAFVRMGEMLPALQLMRCLLFRF